MVSKDKDSADKIKKILLGEQLSSVTFVQDYLQVSFDGTVFTAYIFPEVLVDNINFNSKMPGYKDALCVLIASIVSDVLIDEDKSFNVLFTNNNKLQFNIAPDSTPYEKLMITTHDKHYFIWD